MTSQKDMSVEYMVDVSTGECCDKRKFDSFPCVHLLAACDRHGVDEKKHLDVKDTVEHWKRVYAECPAFQIPSGDMTGGCKSHSNEVEATAIDLMNSGNIVDVYPAPVLPRPAGRPKNARKDRFASAATGNKKARKCGKCGRLTNKHDARSCKGSSEVSTLVNTSSQVENTRKERRNQLAQDREREKERKRNADELQDNVSNNHKSRRFEGEEPAELSPPVVPPAVPPPAVQ